MKHGFIGFSALLVLGFSVSHPAFAAKKTPLLSSYPAIIVEDIDPNSVGQPINYNELKTSRPVLTAKGEHGADIAPADTDKQSKKKDEDSDDASPTPAPTPAAHPSASRTDVLVGFDSVPPQQIQSIAGRLHLVEKLIIEYGRAYDYRTHTTLQLEAILDRLERQKSGIASIR